MISFRRNDLAPGRSLPDMRRESPARIRPIRAGQLSPRATVNPPDGARGNCEIGEGQSRLSIPIGSPRISASHFHKRDDAQPEGGMTDGSRPIPSSAPVGGW